MTGSKGRSLSRDNLCIDMSSITIIVMMSN
jgi:hypothetical protein